METKIYNSGKIAFEGGNDNITTLNFVKQEEFDRFAGRVARMQRIAQRQNRLRRRGRRK